MMQMKMCGCTDAEYDRLKRPMWAKALFAKRRLFRCSTCESHLLVPPDEVEDALQKQRAARSFPIPSTRD
ncbi:hypothetical protein EC845_0929 [Comamonas sp. BIGb0124]|jgi:hypothetical protein|nr:hypothetical protein EC845_0929 [Comamonas sp. BIGb0124]